MGIVELNKEGQIIISSHIITYGDAADETLTQLIRDEIASMWNEPHASIDFRGKLFRVSFIITASFAPRTNEIDVLGNTDPHNNYFRIEEYAQGNISFVDGIGCNTGYFKLENLYRGSTTAAHEYGHTLGLEHPANLDLRGKGVPGIMYPRGTLVDPIYQYDPEKPAGVSGGTMHPMYRKVRREEIELLRLDKLSYQNNMAVLGDFSSIWHAAHTSLESGDA
jgi:hypothetical protein